MLSYNDSKYVKYALRGKHRLFSRVYHKIMIKINYNTSQQLGYNTVSWFWEEMYEKKLASHVACSQTLPLHLVIFAFLW